MLNRLITARHLGLEAQRHFQVQLTETDPPVETYPFDEVVDLVDGNVEPIRISAVSSINALRAP